MTDAIVLGAGMVGVATALALRERGHDVVLADRREPGRETSYGNAGIIQSEAVQPYPLPRDPLHLLRIALRRSNDVNYHLRALPSHVSVLWRYFLASSPENHRRISQVYSRLARRSTADHAPLIEAAGAGDLISRQGFRIIFRDEAAFESEAGLARRISSDYGVDLDLLDGDALASAEPALKRRLAGALHWRDPWTCSDPGGLVAAYTALFKARGGTIVTADARTLMQDGKGWQINGPGGVIRAANVVVALGPWSAPLLNRFGYRVPMLLKRGYHRHFTGGSSLNLPTLDPSLSAFMSPMRAGMRLLTGAELAGLDAPSTPRQIERAAKGVADIIDLGTPVEPEPWYGNRPCMPGMLPAVGRAPRHGGLWFHFGHGHQGFTLGPTTASLLAENMFGGTAPMPELTPAMQKL